MSAGVESTGGFVKHLRIVSKKIREASKHILRLHKIKQCHIFNVQHKATSINFIGKNLRRVGLQGFVCSFQFISIENKTARIRAKH